jgi:hypothetical protein
MSAIGFSQAAHVAWHLQQELGMNKVLDYSSAITHLKSLEMAILTDSSSHYFIHIRNDRINFFPFHEDKVSGKKSYWFGQEVHDAFESAREDISEAGYCLAVEANTAAVYHLTCAAEHGLRALARDRRIVFPKGPIELQQWGDIMRELEKAVAAITNWPKSKAREVALEFYNQALKDCRYFNETYRRQVAHARRQYDRHEALSAMVRAREFMQLLATRISDRKKTPLVWKRA